MSDKIKGHYDMKRISKLALLIISLTLFACEKNDSNDNLYNSINNSRCINENPKDTLPSLFDTIKFGKYEQDNNLENGLEDIEWIIVQIKNDKKFVTLMSKYILDYIEYQHDDIEDKTWETSDIRKFLNDESSQYSKNLKEKRADYFLMYGNFYIDGYESCYSESNNFKRGVRPVIIIHYNDK